MRNTSEFDWLLEFVTALCRTDLGIDCVYDPWGKTHNRLRNMHKQACNMTVSTH